MAKINKKAVLVISLLFAAFFLAGCGSFQGGSDKPPVSAPFVATGTEGIVMDFLPDQPPSKVYTQSPLSFLVEVRNRGTHTVDSAEFYLTGYDMMMMPSLVNKLSLSEPLEGKSPYNPDGGMTTLSLGTSSPIALPQSMPSYKPTFMLTACYPYTTTATPVLCVDPNPQDTVSDKACRVQQVYSTGSQGAPVAVQSIEAESNPTSMYFRIHIANTKSGTDQASGTVYGYDVLGKCPGELSYADLNNVAYMVKLGEQALDCQPNTGKIRLVNDQAVIFCKYQYQQKGGAYETAMTIQLDYGYKSSTSKQVEIENLEFAR